MSDSKRRKAFRAVKAQLPKGVMLTARPTKDGGEVWSVSEQFPVPGLSASGRFALEVYVGEGDEAPPPDADDFVARYRGGVEALRNAGLVAPTGEKSAALHADFLGLTVEEYQRLTPDEKAARFRERGES